MKKILNQTILKLIVVYSLWIFLLINGCSNLSNESDNPEDMVTLIGSINSNETTNLFYNNLIENNFVNKAIAQNNDMVFLFLNDQSVGSVQIKDFKYKFYGGYKGKKISLRFGLTKNDVLLGILSKNSNNTIILPPFDEYYVVTKYIIETQIKENKIKIDDIILSHDRLDISNIVNKVKPILNDKFNTMPNIYGKSIEELLNKINLSLINIDYAFSSANFKIVEDKPKQIYISPSSYSLGIGEKLKFNVNLIGFSDNRVVFKVNNSIGGNSEDGTITYDGLYVAPYKIDFEKLVVITVQSIEDNTKTADAKILLTPITIILNNGNPITLSSKDKDYQIPYIVKGHNDKRLRWYVNDIEYGNILTVGYISSNGRYSKPSKIPESKKVIVKAVSYIDETKFATCEIIFKD